jgi:Cd2+/Zn2+-exporting ATPase
VAHARAAGISTRPARLASDLPGRGCEADIDGRPVLAGNARLFSERGLLPPSIAERVRALAAEGRTAVLIAEGDRVRGLVELADRPRAIARDVVDLIRQQGIEHIAMVTGDNSGAARSVAAAVGVEDVHAELLPADKGTVVGQLRARYGAVAMVGDGVNDAPALAAADLGIAMGAAGSDVALETADVALMGDELAKIPYALRLSRATLRNVRTNVALSVLLKLVFLVLAVTGHATLWMAIVADTGASLLVVANGLRLLRTE